MVKIHYLCPSENFIMSEKDIVIEDNCKFVNPLLCVMVCLKIAEIIKFFCGL